MLKWYTYVIGDRKSLAVRGLRDRKDQRDWKYGEQVFTKASLSIGYEAPQSDMVSHTRAAGPLATRLRHDMPALFRRRAALGISETKRLVKGKVIVEVGNKCWDILCTNLRQLRLLYFPEILSTSMEDTTGRRPQGPLIISSTSPTSSYASPAVSPNVDITSSASSPQNSSPNPPPSTAEIWPTPATRHHLAHAWQAVGDLPCTTNG
nr:hypothetical protein Iba_chr07bCG8560 [Ipomoea batatas]